MMSPNVAIATVLIATIGLTVASVAQADATFDEVKKLTEVGWSTSFKTRAVADAQFDAVKKVAGGKLDAYYAYALVLLKQRRYPEAAKLIKELARVDASNLYYLRTKAWLNTLMREYSSALSTLDQLGRHVAELDEKEQPLRREMTGFLGRMLGFLQGPAGDSSKPSAVAATRTSILGRLAPAEQRILNSQFISVMGRYEEMISESEDTEREAKADAEEERDQLLEDLERQQERMDARRKELGPKRDKLRDEAKAEFDELAKEERPLLQQLGQLEQRAAVLRRELILINDELSRLRSRSGRERDPTIRAALITESNRLSILARRYDADLLGLERRAGNINIQRAEIRGLLQQAQQRYAAELGQIDTELAGIQKQERRNELDERKSQRTRITGKTRLTRAIEAKASALKTYEDLSLEAERDRVLKALRE